jgi:hypothetical protein
MDIQPDDLVLRLREAVAAGDAERLDAWAFDLGTLVIVSGVIPPTVFDEILAQLHTPELHALDGARKLIDAMSQEWPALTDAQKEGLLPAVEQAYPHLREWRACFAASELLGERYADARALESLLRLRRLSPEMPRSFVPHGLEHLAFEGSDAGVRERALAELLDMRGEESERVTGEVEESLARLLAVRVPLPQDVEAGLRARYRFPEGR